METSKKASLFRNLNILDMTDMETTDKTKSANPAQTILGATVTATASQPSAEAQQNTNTKASAGATQTRDDVKLNVILGWPFLDLHKQTSLWFAERQYKRIWEVLGHYFEKHKLEMSLTDRILMNRRLLSSAIRILKETILDNEMESEEKISGFLDRAIRIVFETYRFLNIYIKSIHHIKEAEYKAKKLAKEKAKQKKLLKLQRQQQKLQQQQQPQQQQEEEQEEPEEEQEEEEEQELQQQYIPPMINLVDQDWSFLTSEDEYIPSGIKKPKMLTNREINVLYTLPNLSDLKSKYRKIHEPMTLDKLIEILKNDCILLNLNLELDKFFVNLIQLFTWSAFVYKKFMKFHNAYWFLKEAERIGQEVRDNNNEDILEAIARVQIALSTFYYEAGRTYLAIEKSESSILTLQCELRLRQTKWEFSKSKEAEDSILRCVKTLVTSLINLATYQENLHLYEEAFFSIQTADWFSTKYIKGLDEVKKFASKVQTDFEKLYSDYLQTKGEIEVITERVFWQELIGIYKDQEEKQKKVSSQITQYLDGEVYKRNCIRDLNKMQFVYHKFHTKISWKELDRIQQEEKKKKDAIKKYCEDLLQQKKLQQEKQKQQEQNVKLVEGVPGPNQTIGLGSTIAATFEQSQNKEGDDTKNKQDSSKSDNSSDSEEDDRSSNQRDSQHSRDQINQQESVPPPTVQQDKGNSENENRSKNSQDGNTQIDLDDSASSDDFFGDIFEGFMSEDEDDSGKSKNGDYDDVSDSSLAEANQKFKQAQKKKLVKKKKEYGVNYVPKLLTTNLFFQPLEAMQLNRDHHHHQAKLKSTFKQAKEELKKQRYKSTSRKQPDDFKKELEYNFFQPIKDAMIEGKNKKEIVQQFIQPQTAREYDFQGMDLHIGKQVVSDVNKDGLESKPFQWVGEDYRNEQKIEQKYKRDIRYSRRILNIKRISELENKCRMINFSKFPNKITFDRQIKDEGFVVEAKIGFAKDLQILKKKQEKIIQGEIKHSGKKNLRDLIFSNRDNILFQDANQLKHVYYDYVHTKKEQQKMKHQQQNERDHEKQIKQNKKDSWHVQQQAQQQQSQYLIRIDDEQQQSAIGNVGNTALRLSKMNINDDGGEKSPQSLKNHSIIHQNQLSQPSAVGFQYLTHTLTMTSLSSNKNNNNYNPNTNNNLTNASRVFQSPPNNKHMRQKWTSSSFLREDLYNNFQSKHMTPKNPSKKGSPNKGQKRQESESSDYMVKLAGQKSNVLSKAQQIQQRYENDQKELGSYDKYVQSQIRSKLAQNSVESSKSLKIVVDEVTTNLQKDKKQLQQTKFKLGVTKNLVEDYNFGQLLIEQSEQNLAKSIEGMSGKVKKDFISFTEVVRLARQKKKMENAANKQSGGLMSTNNKI